MTGTGWTRRGNTYNVFTGGIPSIGSSIQSSLAAADSYSMDAAASVAGGNVDNMMEAAMALTMAKANVGVAAVLSRSQDEMMQSTLDMLV